MKAPLTATLLLLHHSLAKHTEPSNDALPQVRRHTSANVISSTLDSLMLRADEQIPLAKAKLWEGEDEEEEEPQRGKSARAPVPRKWPD
jgi:hypothetical protein